MSACSGLEPLTRTTSETVEFESLDLPGRLWDPFMPPLDRGRPVTISGLLTIPATGTPAPAVVIAHGCGGVGGAEMSWVGDLADAGIASLIVDSFGGRGIQQICSGEETINVFSPIIDVYRAAELLDEHPYVDGSRLALMGFSFGGRTAIWSAFTRFQKTYDGRPFAGYAAFYPSTCYIRLQDEAQVSGGPIRLFHGTADNWTPIGQCQQMIDRMSAGGADAGIFPYEGAGHSFDNPGLAWGVEHRSLVNLSPRGCEFVERDGVIIDVDTGNVAGVDSTCVEKGVTYGYDASAREAARTDLLDFLGLLFDKTAPSDR